MTRFDSDILSDLGVNSDLRVDEDIMGLDRVTELSGFSDTGRVDSSASDPVPFGRVQASYLEGSLNDSSSWSASLPDGLLISISCKDVNMISSDLSASIVNGSSPAASNRRSSEINGLETTNFARGVNRICDENVVRVRSRRSESFQVFSRNTELVLVTFQKTSDLQACLSASLGMSAVPSRRLALTLLNKETADGVATIRFWSSPNNNSRILGNLSDLGLSARIRASVRVLHSDWLGFNNISESEAVFSADAENVFVALDEMISLDVVGGDSSSNLRPGNTRSLSFFNDVSRDITVTILKRLLPADFELVSSLNLVVDILDWARLVQDLDFNVELSLASIVGSQKLVHTRVLSSGVLNLDSTHSILMIDSHTVRSEHIRFVLLPLNLWWRLAKRLSLDDKWFTSLQNLNIMKIVFVFNIG